MKYITPPIIWGGICGAVFGGLLGAIWGFGQIGVIIGGLIMGYIAYKVNA